MPTPNLEPPFRRVHFSDGAAEVPEAFARFLRDELAQSADLLRVALDRIVGIEDALGPPTTPNGEPGPASWKARGVAEVHAYEATCAPAGVAQLNVLMPAKTQRMPSPSGEPLSASFDAMGGACHGLLGPSPGAPSRVSLPIGCLARGGGGNVRGPATAHSDPAEEDEAVQRSPTRVDASLQSVRPSINSSTSSPRLQDDLRLRRMVAVRGELFEADGALRGIAHWQNRIRRSLMRPDVSDAGSSRQKQPFVESPGFEIFLSLVIAVNAALVGVEIQWRASNIGDSTPVVFFVLRQIFAVVFVVELLLRLCTFGVVELFWRHGLGWNHFDLIMVVTVVLEVVVDVVSLVVATDDNKNTGRSSALGQLRIMRAIRITRLVRTIRFNKIIRFIAPLRTLVFSIAATLKSLFWSLVLLFMMMYIVGTMITQSVVEAIEMDIEPELEAKLCRFWCSLDTTLMTLYQSVAGGVNWGEPLEPLQELSLLMSWVVVAHISLVYFAVLNVVTAVFCTRAIETTQKNPELVASAIINGRQEYQHNLVSFFSAVDKSNIGSITLDEFQDALADERLRAHLHTLEIDTADAWAMFKLMDTDRSGLITREEFIHGCESLKGGATSVELAKFAAEHRQLAKKLLSFMGEADQHLAEISDKLGSIPDGGMLKKQFAERFVHRGAFATAPLC